MLSLLGVAVLVFASDRAQLKAAYYRILTAIQGGVAGGPVQTSGHVGIVRELDKLFTLRTGTLHVVGVALLAYALLEGAEAIGLWKMKRWAEYLTFVSTTVLLPLEIYEISSRPTVLKVIGFSHQPGGRHLPAGAKAVVRTSRGRRCRRGRAPA